RPTPLPPTLRTPHLRASPLRLRHRPIRRLFPRPADFRTPRQHRPALPPAHRGHPRPVASLRITPPPPPPPTPPRRPPPPPPPPPAVPPPPARSRATPPRLPAQTASSR